jgi:mono/diheme cytochrome c family protein
MKQSTLALLLGSVTFSGALTVVAAQQPASVLAGVYTEGQAKRGEKVYADSCTVCHGPKLTGDLGPPIAGKDFVAGWKDMTVGELLDKIAMSMPSNAPGSLTPQQNADVLAYVLSVNKYPAGQAELGTDVAPLKAVKMAAPPNP